MGRSIYFTDLEIEKLIDYVSDSVELLGEAEGTWEQTAEDMENGLGSAWCLWALFIPAMIE